MLPATRSGRRFGRKCFEVANVAVALDDDSAQTRSGRLQRRQQVALLALQALHVLGRHHADQVRIFAEGFLGTPPAHVSRNVEHRRQSLVTADAARFLADDLPDARAALADLLRRLGMLVDSVAGGDDAVEAALQAAQRGWPYDLLLLVEAHSLKELAYFVSTKLSVLETVTGTATHFVLKRYKSDGVIFEGDAQDKRLAVNP